MIDIILSCLNTFPVSDADVKPMGVENKIIQIYLTFKINFVDNMQCAVL